MRRFVKIAVWLIGTAGILMVQVLWSPISYAEGFLVAQVDIARGHYKLLTYGLPVVWLKDDAALLKQRFGIEQIAVAGCTPSHSLMQYADGYDKASIAGANHKFGRDVFRETAETAEADWTSRHPKRSTNKS